MNRFGLLGQKLGHSFSPEIHSILGSYEYHLYEKDPDELDDFIRNTDFDGLNITIPYKKAVIPYCACVSNAVKSCGSVNTIKRLPDGTLYGDNTDYFGFCYMIKKSGVDMTDKKIVILGNGGAASTVKGAAADLGAREIVIISRTGENNYSNISNHTDAQIIINTTPVGMYPDNYSSPVSLDIFTKCQLAADLIYNPLKTKFLLQAEKIGIKSINGITMLAAQAVKSSEIFTGNKISDCIIDEITRRLISRNSNIILIGMPGCGKTETGIALAGKTGRDFYDVDSIAAEIYGMSVPDIIEYKGIPEFRKVETETLRTVCKHNKAVISTGGGAVTVEENLDILRQNGIIVYIDRKLSELATEGRPLSLAEGPKKLFSERSSLYKSWSDITVKASGILKTADKITMELDI